LGNLLLVVVLCLHQLWTAQATGGSHGAYAQRGYQYNNAGNPSTSSGQALTNFEGSAYAYNDAGHKHAVTHIGGLQRYWYDANGNVITRTHGGLTLTLTYDAENRLTTVSGTLTASYVYDGDGNRVRSVITAGSQVTETHYVGAHYERTLNSGNTKYYFIAGQLVAFERSSGYGVDWGRRFVFRDHPSTALRTGLGSTNVIINGASGLLLWRDRYLPFGDLRDTYRRDAGFSLQTQYRFTGQRLEQRLGTPENGRDRGLYFYGARWYDSSLGRFIQPDTIVPQPGNPQALNRYAYVLNNPLRYVDSTGHCGPLTPVCLALLLGGMALLLQGDSPDLNVTPEDVASQRLGGALFVGGATLAGGSALVGAGGVAKAGTTAATAACADGDCANEVTGVAQRVDKLLKGAPGYNVSPESWFSKYDRIGRTATSVTDKRAISDILGEFEGKGNRITVTLQQAARLEEALGLEPGSLADRFRISKIADIVGRNPASPLVGNEYFLGPGQGLPGGGPELIITRIPTQIEHGIQQILVIVGGR
jgi:RHS repeat-associated protein